MARRGGFVNSFAGVEVSPGLASVVTPATFRNFMRVAALRAGNYWLARWLPRRWDYGYATRVLGADPGRDGMPFFARGRMIMLAASSRAKATARGGGVNLRITVPAAGLAFHAGQRRAFTKLPLQERMDIDDAFTAGMQAAIDEALTGVTSRVTGRRRSVVVRLGQAAKADLAAAKAARSSSMAMRAQLKDMRGRAFQRQREVRQARLAGRAAA